MPRVPRAEILCFGELLWDALPAGLFLGGAPFNVACHLSAAGARVAMVSRVGVDRLGEEAMRRAVSFGVATDLIQIDPELPTGFVRATVDDAGEARYEILAPAAWDAIDATDALLTRAQQAQCIVFGSLSQRQKMSRTTLERLWRSKALMVFDINLRPPHEDVDAVRKSLQRADVVKINRTELTKLAEWYGLPRTERDAAASVAAKFSCPVVCVTRGRDGAALWRDGEWTEHPGYEVEVRDTVGAGDAFLAVLLTGILAGTDSASILQNANLIGAYVATQFGAVPVDQSATTSPSAPGKRPPSSRAKPATKKPSISNRRSRPRGRGGR
jgi:fructokinase